MKCPHSPGPWESSVKSGGGIRLTGPGTETDWWAPIISCPHWDVAYLPGEGNDPTVEADARLIAAAPELLDALKALLADSALGMGEKWLRACDQARTAIAKAEGR